MYVDRSNKTQSQTIVMWHKKEGQNHTCHFSCENVSWFVTIVTSYNNNMREKIIWNWTYVSVRHKFWKKYKNICIKLGVLNNRKYHRIYNLPTLKSIHFKIAFYSTLYRTEHWSMATDKIVMCFYLFMYHIKELCCVHIWYFLHFLKTYTSYLS